MISDQPVADGAMGASEGPDRGLGRFDKPEKEKPVSTRRKMLTGQANESFGFEP
jgi:hypothetical protein